MVEDEDSTDGMEAAESGSAQEPGEPGTTALFLLFPLSLFPFPTPEHDCRNLSLNPPLSWFVPSLEHPSPSPLDSCVKERAPVK